MLEFFTVILYASRKLSLILEIIKIVLKNRHFAKKEDYLREFITCTNIKCESIVVFFKFYNTYILCHINWCVYCRFFLPMTYAITDLRVIILAGKSLMYLCSW